jgi:hypothetical protein
MNLNLLVLAAAAAAVAVAALWGATATAGPKPEGVPGGGVVSGSPRQPVQVRPLDLTSLPRYETRYYVLYSDLDRPSVQDVAVRVTKMAEVYRDRTRDFSGTIRKKLPFVLFKNRDDYLEAGGPEGSAGVFNGKVLMAIAGEQLDNRSWYIIQHEGFHQFAAAVIGGDLPTWVNEGLADYFGEALFTGDDMITGVIPEWRRKRIKRALDEGKFKPIDELMQLSLQEWNNEMSQTNYDQAWSIVQFLAHGEGGKYQRAFSSYMGALGRGKGRIEAWQGAFGDTRGLEDHWKQFWTTLPENPADELYERATVATFTSYLARAWLQKQTFDSADVFIEAAKQDKLKIAEQDHLPRTLMATLLYDVEERQKAGDQIRIEQVKDDKWPRVVLQRREGKRVTGKFKVLGGRITTQVDVEP